MYWVANQNWNELADWVYAINSVLVFESVHEVYDGLIFVLTSDDGKLWR